MKKRMVGCLLATLLTLVLAPVLPAWGGCSTYLGKATINEYYFGTGTNFLEILILNNVQVPQSVWSTWQVQVYNAAGTPVLSYGLNDLNIQACPTSSKTYLTFPVAAGLPSPAGGAINVVLLDADGNEVDYLKFSLLAPIPVWYAPTCSSFSYDTDLVIANMGNKDVARFPDGKGDWAISGGAGSGTTFTSCTGNNANILKAVSAATVPLTGTAWFSITVTNPDNRNITSVSVSDLLPNGLAYVSHTVTAGTYLPASGLWTIGTIVPAASATLTLTFRGDLLGTYTNIANLTYTDNSGVKTSSDFAAVTVVPSNLLDHFVISHDGYGINCLAESVRVTAVNASGAAVTDYSGTITLNTQSGKGTWSLASGSGVFSDPAPSDGLASYTFVAGDAGTTLFSLSYPEGASPLNIRVNDGASVDNDSEGLLYFTPSGFTVTSSSLSNPPPGTIPAFANQIAGSAFTAYLTAYGQTATDPLCGVIEAYSGARNLRFWTSYSNPAYGGLTAPIQPTITAAATISADKVENQTATVLPVTFASGQAQVTIKYKDVGLIGLNLKDTATPVDPLSLPTGIRGGSSLFVVRPSDFTLGNIVRTADAFANPAAADQNGGAFIMAGDPFSVTVTARDAEGAATPSYGQETPAESVSLASLLVAPAGINPALTNPGAFSAFVAGIATGTTFAWDEVGIITLTPTIGDGNYLGAGQVTGTSSGNVGRFTPHHFLLSGVPTFTPRSDLLCAPASIFTYMGEPFQLQFILEAQNAANVRTNNYSGGYARLNPATSAPFHFGAVSPGSATSLTARLDLGLPPAGSWLAGSGNFTITMAVNRGGGVDGPFADLLIGMAPLDTDNVAYRSADFDLDADLNASNERIRLATTQLRFGRLVLQNSYGSELLALSLPLRAEYYDGSSFASNAADSCTAYNGVTTTLANYRFNLQSGETSASGAGTLLAGAENPATPLQLSPPGAGNDGSVDVTLPIDSWLRFDWDGNGAHDNNPAARASFGIYKGNPRLIYRREVIQ